MRKLWFLPLIMLGLMAWAESSDEGRAFYELAEIYEKGNDSIAADPDKSSEYYKQSALLGYVPAQSYLGYLFYRDKKVENYIDSALYWTEKAAENGDIKAAGNLGFLLTSAPDIPHDYERALKWLEKAADAGLPTSFTNLAELYGKGLGVSPDTVKAINLYDRAIIARVRDAEQRLLAMMGYKWKNLPADSALNMGLYYNSIGAPTVALDLFEDASDKGNAKAMGLTGLAYSRGTGTFYDHDKAMAWFLKSALAGDPSAQFILSETLEIFPDALDEVISVYNEQPEEFLVIHPKPGELTAAEFWRDKALLGGVADADEAYKRLLKPEL